MSIPSGIIGQSCSISPAGKSHQCGQLASAIDTCKASGVKVILSLGGASGAYSLSSQEEAQSIGQKLWEAYGHANISRVPRPFGDTFVNGWDFDIEASGGNQYYHYLIDQLRSNFESDPTNTYYITGAPQFLQQSQLLYLTGVVNYVDWVRNVANTSSADAKIFIGVPASPLAATGTSSGAQYYVTPRDLTALVRRYSRYNAFGGVMMWSAGFSDTNVENGRTFAQEVKQVLTNLVPS
ncbi:chitinase [Penicillium sp. IBT 16267x]|nr:chitinase [Penicillium sp. IBT 16267x]